MRVPLAAARSVARAPLLALVCTSALACTPAGATTAAAPLPPAPRATFTAFLPDPGYAAAPYAPQDVKPAVLVGALVHPTLGFPALVRPGGTLRIVLYPGATGLLSPADFSVTLRFRRGAAAYFPLVPAAADAVAPPTGDDLLLERPLEVRLITPEPGGVTALEAVLPLDTPALAWDLAVSGPPSVLKAGEEVQPLAVRVLPAGDWPDRLGGFVFALAADHQLWDPSSFVSEEKNAGIYPPAAGSDDSARAMAMQIQHELGIIAPAFVLYAGDLLFGLDYTRELADSLELWRRSSFATFFAPGNHDAYASYTLDLGAAAGVLGGGSKKCEPLRPSSFDAIALFRFVGCVYGDAKDVLFRHLVEDGLVAWERALGPAWYAFDHDAYRFIVLDTYDGSAARRHAIVLGLAWAGLDIGVPTTDNYGGYVGPEQLAWLERTAREGALAGLTVIVLGHHDPRGNLEGGADGPVADRYVANDPFPTSPFGTGPFEEWNYDGAWDSDPADGRGVETAAVNSGTAVLGVLAAHASYYLYGHGHDDERTAYDPGRELAPGIRVARPLTFVRVTTAAALTRGEGYRGYALLRARDGRLEGAAFHDALGLPSVPAGNFWLAGRVRPGLALPSVLVEGHNALPTPVLGQLALPLPPFAGGYDARPAGGGAPLPLLEVADGAGTKVMVWGLELPGIGAATRFPPPAGAETITKIEVRPAAGNHPPEPRIRIFRGGVDVGAEAYLPSGDTVLLSGATSTDPDGDAPWRALWSFGDGGTARGLEAAHVFVGLGPRLVRLTLTDPHGATATTEVAVRVSPPVIAPAGPPKVGCRCAVVGVAGAENGPLVLVVGLVVLGLGARPGGGIRRARGSF